MHRGLSLFVCCTFLSFIAGCESYSPVQGVVVTGKVLQGGQPVSTAPTPDGYNGAQVEFFSGTAAATVPCEADGKFRIEYEGGGLPPGKYKVAIYVRKDGPDSDILENKLGRDSTTIEFDIPQDKMGGEMDVGTIEIADHLK